MYGLILALALAAPGRCGPAGCSPPAAAHRPLLVRPLVARPRPALTLGARVVNRRPLLFWRR
jgi:hypothetical protein